MALADGAGAVGMGHDRGHSAVRTPSRELVVGTARGSGLLIPKTSFRDSQWHFPDAYDPAWVGLLDNKRFIGHKIVTSCERFGKSLVV
jgi:hypothetical protein